MHFIKANFIFAFTLLLLAGSGLAYASGNGEEPGEQNYALMIRKVKMLNPAMTTLNMLEDRHGGSVDNFEVVICGGTVNDLPGKTGLVNRALQQDITVSVCGMSVNNNPVSRDELPEGINLVDNGFIRMFDLQQMGYQTVSL